MRTIIEGAVITVICWAVLSVAGSAFKTGSDSCGKAHYIQYVLFTDLFCEIN